MNFKIQWHIWTRIEKSMTIREQKNHKIQTNNKQREREKLQTSTRLLRRESNRCLLSWRNWTSEPQKKQKILRNQQQQTIESNQTLINTIDNNYTETKKKKKRLTRKVVDEGDRDGAANDGVHPEPPPGAEYGARHSWPEYCPQLWQIHFCDFWSDKNCWILFVPFLELSWSTPTPKPN